MIKIIDKIIRWITPKEPKYVYNWYCGKCGGLFRREPKFLTRKKDGSYICNRCKKYQRLAMYL